MVIFTRKAPRFPGAEPSDTTSEIIQAQWTKNADLFARFYLTMFRVEYDCYEYNHVNNYKYDWKAFQSWIMELEEDDAIISKF